MVEVFQYLFCCSSWGITLEPEDILELNANYTAESFTHCCFFGQCAQIYLEVTMCNNIGLVCIYF